MKIFKVLLFSIVQCTILNAQQLEVINVGGDYFENNQGSITFSIGEVVIETIEYGELCFTQGFCQSYITITAINDFVEVDYQILAYPNPTTDYIILNINRDKLNGLKYFLYDMKGEILGMKEIDSNETMIPFHLFKPSTYFVKIFDKRLEVKTFKIIKPY